MCCRSDNREAAKPKMVGQQYRLRVDRPDLSWIGGNLAEFHALWSPRDFKER
jgi:hypothetical protein